VRPVAGRAGIGTGREDRRAERSNGVYADYGGKYSVEAVKMAIDDFGGEVLGQRIELVTADYHDKPDLAAGAFQGREEVDIVLGAATSAITGSACSPYGFHCAFDTRALTVGTGGALVKTGDDA
jgi:branched-chain amino acid transport system substrate-binding protein